MTAQEIKQLSDALADVANNSTDDGNGLIYIVLSLMLGVGPYLVRRIRKAINKGVDQKVKTITEEVVKPIQALTSSINQMNEDHMEANKMFMEELSSLMDKVEDHEERIQSIEKG